MKCATRWYDKDKFSKVIVETMELLDEETRVELALDLVQVIIQGRYIDRVDDFIEKVNVRCFVMGKRWYDKNATVCSAIEMLKHIDISKKSDLLKEFLCSLMSLDQRIKRDDLEIANEYISWN